MKPTNFIKHVTTSLLIVSLVMFCVTSCSKDKEQVVEQKSMVSDNLVLANALTSEIADFHTIVMSQYLSTGVLDEAIPLSYEVVSEIKGLLTSQIDNYKFNYVMWDSSAITFINDFITCDNLKVLIENSSNLDFGNIQFENVDNAGLAAYVNSLDLSMIRDCCGSFENLILDFISSSNSFDEYEQKYVDYIHERLEPLWYAGYKDEYFYIKLYFDIGKSTIRYMTDYYLDKLDDQKGPRWDKFKNKVKEVWNEVKPVVAADVEGAVAGGMLGAVAAGVGAGPGAVTGACATSAGYCAGAIVNGL